MTYIEGRGVKALLGTLLAVVLVLAGCTPSPQPASVPPTTTAPPITSVPPPTVAPTPTSMTYTVEPYLGTTVTQIQFGGKMCPCTKVGYTPDGLHNQQGADAIYAAASKMYPGDILMGFSLGVQVISLYLAQHTPPPGVIILLAGDTFNRNQQLVSAKQGIPWDIPNQVIMVANEYDGWSDGPDLISSAHYSLANQNAITGALRLHYYANADISSPANVVTKRGNITAVLIPTAGLPTDPTQRADINSAYSRPASTPAQQAAAASEQVPWPNPMWVQRSESVVGP